MKEISNIDVLSLAYIGDAVYEVYVRDFLLKKEIFDVNILQEKATNYVSAVSQSKLLDYILEKNVLNKEEIDVVMRARNHKIRSKPRHTKIVDYKKATAFESLIGYLHLKGDKDRVDYIISLVLRGD